MLSHNSPSPRVGVGLAVLNNASSKPLLRSPPLPTNDCNHIIQYHCTTAIIMPQRPYGIDPETHNQWCKLHEQHEQEIAGFQANYEAAKQELQRRFGTLKKQLQLKHIEEDRVFWDKHGRAPPVPIPKDKVTRSNKEPPSLTTTTHSTPNAPPVKAPGSQPAGSTLQQTQRPTTAAISAQHIRSVQAPRQEVFPPTPPAQKKRNQDIIDLCESSDDDKPLSQRQEAVKNAVAQSRSPSVTSESIRNLSSLEDARKVQQAQQHGQSLSQQHRLPRSSDAGINTNNQPLLPKICHPLPIEGLSIQQQGHGLTPEQRNVRNESNRLSQQTMHDNTNLQAPSTVHTPPGVFKKPALPPSAASAKADQRTDTNLQKARSITVHSDASSISFDLPIMLRRDYSASTPSVITSPTTPANTSGSKKRSRDIILSSDDEDGTEDSEFVPSDVESIATQQTTMTTSAPPVKKVKTSQKHDAKSNLPPSVTQPSMGFKLKQVKIKQKRFQATPPRLSSGKDAPQTPTRPTAAKPSMGKEYPTTSPKTPTNPRPGSIASYSLNSPRGSLTSPGLQTTPKPGSSLKFTPTLPLHSPSREAESHSCSPTSPTTPTPKKPRSTMARKRNAKATLKDSPRRAAATKADGKVHQYYEEDRAYRTQCVIEENDRGEAAASPGRLSKLQKPKVVQADGDTVASLAESSRPPTPSLSVTASTLDTGISARTPSVDTRQQLVDNKKDDKQVSFKQRHRVIYDDEDEDLDISQYHVKDGIVLGPES